MKKFLFMLFVVSIICSSLLFPANTTSAEEMTNATPTTELTSAAAAEEMANTMFVNEKGDEAVLPPPTDPVDEFRFQTGYVYVTPVADVLSVTKTVVALAGAN